MAKRFQVPVAVFPILLRQHAGRACEVLLHRRRNTGYGDGRMDLAGGGHVEAGESMSAAILREMREELGIVVKRESLRFATMLYSHDRSDGSTYVDVFFRVDAFSGTPEIREPERAEALAWHPLDALPADLLEDRRMAIESALSATPFGERGFEEEHTR